MAEPLADQVMRKIELTAALYYRLLLVVAPVGGGKTEALQIVRGLTGAPLVNVNLEISRRMLELTERHRILQLPRILREIIGNDGGGMILLDNIEIIFDAALQQDPLRLLKGLSRNRTVVAAWNGAIVEGSLIYSDPDHAEHRRYPVRDYLVASPEVTI